MFTKGKQKLPKQTILILAGLLVVVTGILGYKIWEINHATNPVAFDDPKNQKLLDAEPIEQILVFSFDVNKTDKTFTVGSISQYNGRPQVAGKNTAKPYSFAVVEDGQPAYVTYFSSPEIHVESFNEDGTITTVGTLAEPTFAIRTPRFKDGSTYIIRDSAGTVVLEGTVGGVIVNDNEPDYKSTVAE